MDGRVALYLTKAIITIVFCDYLPKINLLSDLDRCNVNFIFLIGSSYFV